MNIPTPRPKQAALEQHTQWLGLLFLAICLHVFEHSLPSLGPWFKPGLANIMTLICWAIFGLRSACVLAISRVFCASLITGSLLTPTFIIAFCSALAVCVLLSIAKYLPFLSLIGLSLLAAMAHICTQFLTVNLFFFHQASIFYMMPPILLMSCVSAWFNGMVALAIVRHLSLGLAHHHA